jgi:DNA-binding transcriptional MerR regulator
MNEVTTVWLTAAECALRTGLTVRALRVYEKYGLIAPGRSAAGWRRYGAQELLKLNEIGLLKVLGLTLNQIRDLTRRPLSPTLRQLLELQLGAWKSRRAEAERGLAVAEAALQQLQAGRSLSVEELCSLIRSCEMTTSTPRRRFPLPTNKCQQTSQHWIAMSATTSATAHWGYLRSHAKTPS